MCIDKKNHLICYCLKILVGVSLFHLSCSLLSCNDISSRYLYQVRLLLIYLPLYECRSWEQSRLLSSSPSSTTGTSQCRYSSSAPGYDSRFLRMTRFVVLPLVGSFSFSGTVRSLCSMEKKGRQLEAIPRESALIQSIWHNL